MTAVSIDPERLWQSLMELARIGATDKGGVRRLALTSLDGEARDLFTRWCRQAGCSIAIDGIGNIFARRAGCDNALPPIVTGSHIDTQPSGGKFDGNYGVMSGLEVIRTLNDHKIETQAPIEVVVWTNEEGSRFTPVMMGSGVFAGAFSLESTLLRADLEGITVSRALNQIGYAGTEQTGSRPVGAYFEAHIEQGPILEDMRVVIGVVVGALGLRWYDITVCGEDAHAGPTPMRLSKMRCSPLQRWSQRSTRLHIAINLTVAARSDSCKSSPIRATSFPARCDFRWICVMHRMQRLTACKARCRRRASDWRRRQTSH